MNIADSLLVDTNLTYCPTTLNLNQPLNITNVSQHQLVYKVKTNKKNFISMNPCNGFIKPNQKLSIPVKIVETVPQNVTIKLQVDWALVTPEMKQKNDIKMATVTEKDIFKEVFPIIRKQETEIQSLKQNNEALKLNKSTSQTKKSLQEKKITPFEYEKKQETKQEVQSPKKPVPQMPKKTQSEVKSQSLKQQQIPDDVYQYRSANNMLVSLSSPSKGLQIVSEQDEEDHENQLKNIRFQQVQELRRIDEIKSKARKLTQQIKSNEIIDSKLLFLAIIGSFLFGSLVQFLVF